MTSVILADLATTYAVGVAFVAATGLACVAFSHASTREKRAAAGALVVAAVVWPVALVVAALAVLVDVWRRPVPPHAPRHADRPWVTRP